MAQQVDTLNVDESQMTLMEHLIELRWRLMWVVSAIAVGTILGLIVTVSEIPYFEFNLLEFITSPLASYGKKLQALGPTDTIIIALKVSFTAGTVVAIPVIAIQIIGFVAPGLYAHEKRALYLMIPGIIILFVVGAAFAFFVMLPVAIDFLQNFLNRVIEQEWTITHYIALVTRIVFWIGVSFEMPLVITVLARLGFVSGPALLKFWRHAVVVIAIVAAIITPTIDPVNMAIVMAPLFVLYLLSVGMAYLVYRPRDPRDFSID